MSNCATLAFLWENVTIMVSLKVNSSCDLEFGLYSKLMIKFRIMSNQDQGQGLLSHLTRFCMFYAYTRSNKYTMTRDWSKQSPNTGHPQNQNGN